MFKIQFKTYSLLYILIIFIFLSFSDLSAEDDQNKKILRDILIKTQEIAYDIDYLRDLSLALLQRNVDDIEAFALNVVVLKNMKAFQSNYKTTTIIILYGMLDSTKKDIAKEIMRSTFEMILKDLDSAIEDFYPLKTYAPESDNTIKKISRIIKNYNDIRFHIKNFYTNLN